MNAVSEEHVIARHSILVVEDEPLILFDTIDMIEDEGFEAFEAANAAKALAVLEQHPYIDVLFTDIDMPGEMDGLALAQIVRKRWPDIAIVIVSGHHRPIGPEIPQGGKFLPKPYVREAVLRALKDVLKSLDD
ncbi:response regulator [Rhizobium sp. DKSPLA3]|uniref:Response regulator n=1 Tax=Rhizobium quercicola TaxID=2901226 RepID=A0A9X1NU71_9HYPH|nr:response regulator [Rhizobium quercicola]MCD7109398.1 response regulator [Rhizobium quercicola]